MSEKEFAAGMKTLGIAFGKEINADILKVYYEILKSESYNTMKKAISEIIKKSKFFPTVSDLLEECKKQRTANGFAILEFMKSQGYFHESEYGISEYEKATNWLATGVIPSWFKEDMEKYAKQLTQKELSSNETRRLNYEQIKSKRNNFKNNAKE